MSVTLGVLSLCAALAAPAAVRAHGPVPTVAPAQSVALAKWSITVSAGPLDRVNTVVQARLGSPKPGRGLVVRDSKGAPVSSMALADGSLFFTVKSLKAGSQATFTAEETAKPARPEKAAVEVTASAKGITAKVNGKPVVTYQGEAQAPHDVAAEFARSGYLHPLVSPSGVVVTADYPKDKPAQHGIWSAWDKVNFDGHVIDFRDPTRKQGRVARESMGPVASGAAMGWFGTHQYFTDASTGATVLREGWSITVHRPEPGRRYNMLDLDVTSETMQGRPVNLEQSLLGGTFLRGPAQWQGAAQSVFLSSEGATRAAAKGAASRWIYLGGKVSGKPVGVAILSSPKYSQAPQSAYVDGEDPVFGFAPAGAAPVAVTSSKPLHLAYRFVVIDGAPDAKLFDQLWKDYANPPQVDVISK